MRRWFSGLLALSLILPASKAWALRTTGLEESPEKERLSKALGLPNPVKTDPGDSQLGAWSPDPSRIREWVVLGEDPSRYLAGELQRQRSNLPVVLLGEGYWREGLVTVVPMGSAPGPGGIQPALLGRGVQTQGPEEIPAPFQLVIFPEETAPVRLGLLLPAGLEEIPSDLLPEAVSTISPQIRSSLGLSPQPSGVEEGLRRLLVLAPEGIPPAPSELELPGFLRDVFGGLPQPLPSFHVDLARTVEEARQILAGLEIPSGQPAALPGGRVNAQLILAQQESDLGFLELISEAKLPTALLFAPGLAEKAAGILSQAGTGVPVIQWSTTNLGSSERLEAELKPILRDLDREVRLIQRREILAQARELAMIPVKSLEEAVRLGRLAAQEGFIPEISLRENESLALEAIQTLAREPTIPVVAAGEILYESQVANAVEAGARVVSTPGVLPKVILRARQEGALVIGGAGSFQEARLAGRAGVDLLKVFPFRFEGEEGLERALKAPLPLELRGRFDRLVKLVEVKEGIGQERATFTSVLRQVQEGKELKTFAIPQIQGLGFINEVAEGVLEVPLIPVGGIQASDLAELFKNPRVIAVGFSVTGQQGEEKLKQFAQARQEIIAGGFAAGLEETPQKVAEAFFRIEEPGQRVQQLRNLMQRRNPALVPIYLGLKERLGGHIGGPEVTQGLLPLVGELARGQPASVRNQVRLAIQEELGVDEERSGALKVSPVSPELIPAAAEGLRRLGDTRAIAALQRALANLNLGTREAVSVPLPSSVRQSEIKTLDTTKEARGALALRGALNDLGAIQAAEYVTTLQSLLQNRPGLLSLLENPAEGLTLQALLDQIRQGERRKPQGLLAQLRDRAKSVSFPSVDFQRQVQGLLEEVSKSLQAVRETPVGIGLEERVTRIGVVAVGGAALLPEEIPMVVLTIGLEQTITLLSLAEGRFTPEQVLALALSPEEVKALELLGIGGVFRVWHFGSVKTAKEAMIRYAREILETKFSVKVRVLDLTRPIPGIPELILQLDQLDLPAWWTEKIAATGLEQIELVNSLGV